MKKLQQVFIAVLLFCFSVNTHANQTSSELRDAINNAYSKAREGDVSMLLHHLYNKQEVMDYAVRVLQLKMFNEALSYDKKITYFVQNEEEIINDENEESLFIQFQIITVKPSPPGTPSTCVAPSFIHIWKRSKKDNSITLFIPISSDFIKLIPKESSLKEVPYGIGEKILKGEPFKTP